MQYRKKCGIILKKKSGEKRKTKAIPLIKVAWDPIYVHPLPEKHRFPMEKYELLPQQLLLEGTLDDENFFRPKAVSEEDILAVHTATYWRRLSNLELSRKEQLRSGFPHSALLIEREKVIVLNNYNVAEFDLVMANDNFDNGKEELHEYLDDIDERREVIKALKRDVFVLNRKVEDHWNTDDMNLRNRYLLAVEGIHQNPLKGKIQKAESM